MFGSGAEIGMMRIITRVAPKTIPGVLEGGKTECFAAAPGTIILGPCGRRTAAGTLRRPGTTTAVSAWALLPVSCLLFVIDRCYSANP